MSKRAAALLSGAFGAILLTATAAWACTNLATLNVDKTAVEPGSELTVTGSSFSTAAKGGQPVEVKLDDSIVLATATPDAAGNISTSVVIPADTRPGYHVLVATQQEVGKDGAAKAAYGTPARASVLVGAQAEGAAQAEPSSPVVLTADGGSSSGIVALTALLAILGLGLFGAGLGMFVRDARRRAVPVAAEDRR